jgi:hypothetical protein
MHRLCEGFVLDLPKGKLLSIVLISAALLLRYPLGDGRILRDRVLCGFCVRMNARKPACRRLPDGWAGNSGLAKNL